MQVGSCKVLKSHTTRFFTGTDTLFTSRLTRRLTSHYSDGATSFMAQEWATGLEVELHSLVGRPEFNGRLGSVVSRN